MDEVNSTCVLKDGSCLKVLNIVQSTDDVFILGKVNKYSTKQDLFTYPCKSSFLGVDIVSRLSSTVKCVPLNNIMSKCVLLPFENNAVIFPLLNK